MFDFAKLCLGIADDGESNDVDVDMEALQYRPEQCSMDPKALDGNYIGHSNVFLTRPLEAEGFGERLRLLVNYFLLVSLSGP